MSYWQATEPDGPVQLNLERTNSGTWLIPLQIIVAILIAMVLLLLAAPWMDKSWRSSMEPEIIALLGVAVGYLLETWLLTLALLAICLNWRLVRVMLAAYAHWATGNSLEPAALNHISMSGQRDSDLS